MKFKKTLYPKIALIKAAYNYTDKAYVHLDADESYYYVTLQPKDSNTDFSEAEFLNEMLAQTVRHEIYVRTKNIRELLLARAMASSLIAEPSAANIHDDDDNEFSENEILKDWFAENDSTGD